MLGFLVVDRLVGWVLFEYICVASQVLGENLLKFLRWVLSLVLFEAILDFLEVLGSGVDCWIIKFGLFFFN